MKQLEFMTHKRIAEIIHEIRAAASSNLCYITAQAAATVSSRETSYKRAYPITWLPPAWTVSEILPISPMLPPP